MMKNLLMLSVASIALVACNVETNTSGVLECHERNVISDCDNGNSFSSGGDVDDAGGNENNDSPVDVLPEDEDEDDYPTDPKCPDCGDDPEPEPDGKQLPTVANERAEEATGKDRTKEVPADKDGDGIPDGSQR